MPSMIGIKLANGHFYPILPENSCEEKRLILTTANDNQSSVQIDLFREKTTVSGSAQYIGSIVVDNIVAAPAKEPSIALDVRSSESGVITATAVYLDGKHSEESMSLQISLSSINNNNSDDNDTPLDSEEIDFEINFEDIGIESDAAPGNTFAREDEQIEEQVFIGDTRKKAKRSIVFIIIAILLVLLLAGGAIILFSHLSVNKGALLRSQHQEEVEILELEAPGETGNNNAGVELPDFSSTVPEEIALTPAVEPTPVSPPPPPPPPPPTKTPAAPKVNREIIYKIKYGDTLWDIANRYYKNPWAYKRIAEYNDLRNPAQIISGTSIRIPQ